MSSGAARSVLFLMAMIAISLPRSAMACMMDAPFQIEDIRQADVVFSGTLIKYERVSPGRPDSLDDYGLLTVRVDEVLKGEAFGDVELYWWNSTFAMPDKIYRPDPIIVAATRADGGGLPLRAPSATVFRTRRPDLLQIMQAPCSVPFILASSPKAMNNIRMILKDGKPKRYDYFGPRGALR